MNQDDSRIIQAVILGVFDALGVGRRRRASAFTWILGPVTAKTGPAGGGLPIRLVPKGGTIMLVLKSDQKVALAIQPVDSANNPAKVDGVPAWSVSDPAVLSLSVADDGLSAEVVTVGPVGIGQVNVSADADLGDGIRTISGTLDIEVQAAEAVALAIMAGVPVPKV